MSAMQAETAGLSVLGSESASSPELGSELASSELGSEPASSLELGSDGLMREQALTWLARRQELTGLMQEQAGLVLT